MEMKILIAVDESRYSKAAVESVASRPWLPGTRFLVLSVIPSMVPGYADWHGPYVATILEAQQTMRSLHEHIVFEHVKFLKEKLPNCYVEGRLEEGMVKGLILDTSKQWQADFIILGTHGRTGVARFLMGSVAEEVLESATCSVEIIRSPEPGHAPVTNAAS